MSEPTPLNAEELDAVRAWKPLTVGEFVEAVRWWLSMSSYRKGKHSRYLATIDAQATEIAALKGALESIEDAWAKLVEPGWQTHVASLKGADAPETSHAWVKHIFTFQLAGFRARVLAGKETRDE